ncbi:AAA family ATPase [Jeotgalibacillus aurantiacus]|uniref:AAA family ATPase n=1 Tax=Jeotgalibacillus aurantiacus TaxID=2763266 RepID=UPI001D0A48F1|nr:AAA family ATPase [Jeotgalibacillus aurantiacus]
MNNVYVITGPAGVGKSTVSKALSKRLENSAYISGDDLYHMHINGKQAPWDEQGTQLTWQHILSLTLNFLEAGCDVVIDYIAFPNEAAWLKKKLGENVNFSYIVLWTDEKTLIERDKMRQPDHQMGERSLELLNDFKNKELLWKAILETGDRPKINTELIVDEVLLGDRFKWGM